MRVSLRSLRIMLAGGLFATFVASGYGLQVRRAHDVAGVALRDARIALQRAETVRAVLASDTGQLASLDLSLESFELALIEAVTQLADTTGVSELQYKRIIETQTFMHDSDIPVDDPTPLRIALTFRSDHAVALLRTLQALAARIDQRPLQFSGCRLLRAPRSLAASCAVDWFWWDTA